MGGRQKSAPKIKEFSALDHRIDCGVSFESRAIVFREISFLRSYTERQVNDRRKADRTIEMRKK